MEVGTKRLASLHQSHHLERGCQPEDLLANGLGPLLFCKSWKTTWGARVESSEVRGKQHGPLEDAVATLQHVKGRDSLNRGRGRGKLGKLGKLLRLTQRAVLGSSLVAVQELGLHYAKENRFFFFYENIFKASAARLWEELGLWNKKVSDSNSTY